jgi:hypothetical protein
MKYPIAFFYAPQKQNHYYKLCSGYTYAIDNNFDSWSLLTARIYNVLIHLPQAASRIAINASASFWILCVGGKHSLFARTPIQTFKHPR